MGCPFTDKSFIIYLITLGSTSKGSEELDMELSISYDEDPTTGRRHSGTPVVLY